MNSALEIALVPFSVLYRMAIGARLWMYRAGIFETRKSSVPVISVGNLTTGGTGKTPIVECIARILAANGMRVCVLTRGYARRNPTSRVLVSDGSTILADAEDAGDEAYLLGENLLHQAAVVSDPDRVSAALWATRELGSQVFVLDDGFQHLGIARDLNIAVIDATNPCGSDRLLPAGRLREPVEQLARADVVILSRTNLEENLSGTIDVIARLAPKAQVFRSRVTCRSVVDMSGRTVPDSDVEGLKKQQVFAFCGLGNPKAFFDQLTLDGWTGVLTRRFKDHHAYTQDDIDAMIEAAKVERMKALLTTAKDAVKIRKLQFEIPCYVIDIAVTFDDKAGFEHVVLGVLSEH